MTMVSCMPASLWTCFFWKSGREFISTNDRRVGYLTTPIRSQVGESPSNWASTSPKKTTSAPMSASTSSGA